MRHTHSVAGCAVQILFKSFKISMESERVRIYCSRQWVQTHQWMKHRGLTTSLT